MAACDLVLTPTGVRFLGRRFPCVIGRGGIRVTKKEGDGGTPVGRHRIVGMLYRPDRMLAPAPWARPIRPSDYWCDDPDHLDYNHLVRGPVEASAERMWRSDPLYDLVLLTDWNWPDAVPGAGSAIFAHRWRSAGRPTEGCLAFNPQHLRWIAARIFPGTPVVVIG